MALAVAAFVVAFVALAWSGMVGFAGSMGSGHAHALRMLLLTLPLPLIAVGLGAVPVCRAIGGVGKVSEAIACLPGILLGVFGICQAVAWYLEGRG